MSDPNERLTGPQMLALGILGGWIVLALLAWGAIELLGWFRSWM